MEFLSKIFQGKPGNTFRPALGRIRSQTKRFVEGIFIGKTPAHQEIPFTEGIPGINTHRQKTGFQAFPHTKERNTGFQHIPIRSMEERDLIGNIDTRSLSPTNRKIQKVHLALPYDTHLFNHSGEGIEILKKGTFVNFDNESPIFSILDSRTGKYQAYAKIQSTVHHQDASKNTLEHTEGGYIRAPWLDGVIQRENTTRGMNTNKGKESKKISFSGYIGPDGQEIPAYLLRSVTINYFGTVIATKVDTELMNINQDIVSTRKSIIAEVMGKSIPAKETSGYKKQQYYIQKRNTWTELSHTIGSIKTEGDKAFEHPSISQIMKSIQSKPTWQTLIQRASYIHIQQRKGHIPRRTHH